MKYFSLNLSCNWTTGGSEQAEEENIQDDSVSTEKMICKRFYLVIFFWVMKWVNLWSPRHFYTIQNSCQCDYSFRNATDLAELDFPSPPSDCNERLPISGLVEITVTHDETRPRGISLIEIQGATGSDLKNLEDICLRGATLGLPGRVWANGMV